MGIPRKILANRQDERIVAAETIMKNTKRWTLISLAVLALVLTSGEVRAVAYHAATCLGKDPCKACKNCKYCAHCAKEGGTCGICKR
jgi:hypothetical protein